jgi:hypothetical protein
MLRAGHPGETWGVFEGLAGLTLPAHFDGMTANECLQVLAGKWRFRS